MQKQIKLPPFGNEDKAVTLVSWEVNEGQEFRAGDVLYEVESDKVVSQVEAEEAGRLSKQIVAEGDKVQVGTMLATYESLEA